MRKKEFAGIIGTSLSMLTVLDLIRIIAPKDVKVLIRGERGTGKELVANALHGMSDRSKMPLITINCAALSRDLLASELFGHVKGSFTGATSTRTGLIMSADGGTLFLDEIGDLSPDAQAALLRFLQDGEVRPVGSLQTFKVNVRVISATNKNLEEAMERGLFREDLYDRLNGFTLKIPPLRYRRQDIPILVDHFIEKYNQRYGENVRRFNNEVMKLFMNHPWNGNVRELENVVCRAVIIAQGRKIIGLADLQHILSSDDAPVRQTVRQRPDHQSKQQDPPAVRQKNIDGWTVQRSRQGYFRIYKKINGKLRSIYIGKQVETDVVREKIQNFLYNLD